MVRYETPPGIWRSSEMSGVGSGTTTKGVDEAAGVEVHGSTAVGSE